MNKVIQKAPPLQSLNVLSKCHDTQPITLCNILHQSINSGWVIHTQRRIHSNKCCWCQTGLFGFWRLRPNCGRLCLTLPDWQAVPSEWQNQFLNKSLCDLLASIGCRALHCKCIIWLPVSTSHLATVIAVNRPVCGCSDQPLGTLPVVRLSVV